ncbi:hypothetical protein DTO027B5_6185 [Paecilomyces variotii]|nr:hypothetical protein DTO027B3_6856 [Paecilomyces variotii]KAJ9332046.1 hypothetical protein DTO027B5_6185 [Paecilomyces variotii]KAJ9395396.1 hypothetical protein DTO282F9_7650 [Paecilomyces variotii]
MRTGCIILLARKLECNRCKSTWAKCDCYALPHTSPTVSRQMASVTTISAGEKQGFRVLLCWQASSKRNIL